jgi:transposase
MDTVPLSEVMALRRVLAEAQTRATIAEAHAANAKASVSDLAARNALLELQIEKLKRERFGPRSERSQRLIEQMELMFEELEATATEDALLAEKAAAKTTDVKPFTRSKPTRRPFPEHLPVERVVVAARTICDCCGSDRLSKLGETVTRTMESVPRQFKIIETVREKFTCRSCEKISQPPAPFHVTPRGLFGPSFLAMLVFEKFGQHQPLNRQRDRYALEGVDLSLSTLADQIGACAIALKPLHLLIEAHALAAERLHGDDTSVPVLAPGKTDIARFWTYVRDDRPFGGPAPPVVVFYYSRNRKGEHPRNHLSGYTGLFQADAYGGYNELMRPSRTPGPVKRALCWAHGRRNFFVLADIATQLKRRRKPVAEISPLAIEAVKRIDAIFEIERTITGKTADERLVVRQEFVAPLVAKFEDWMRTERARLSRHNPIAGAIDYMLKEWEDFTRFLTDGRICLTNNAAERALRGIALGRKSWMFVGSDRGGERAAFMYTLIATAKLNDIDPQAWLADVLARIADISQNRLHELLPWNWRDPKHSTAIEQAA